MATYLIDYENPAGKMFFDFADDYCFPACRRLSDFVKKQYGMNPCTTFWETVNRYDWQQPCACNNVVLFYSLHSPKANLEGIKAKCTDSFEYVPNGVKNGLDFHLTTYLGGLIHGDAGMPIDSRFYIVSGDKGFGSAFHFLEANSNFGGLSFGLITNEDDFRKAFITEELSWLSIYCLLYVPNLEENLEQAGKRRDHASKQCDEIIAAFFRQSDKGLLHNEIQRIVGNGDVCKKIYHLVCPVFDRYRVFSAHF